MFSYIFVPTKILTRFLIFQGGDLLCVINFYCLQTKGIPAFLKILIPPAEKHDEKASIKKFLFLLLSKEVPKSESA